jgi:hypothetical protein
LNQTKEADMTGNPENDPCKKEKELLREKEDIAYMASKGGSIPPSFETLDNITQRFVSDDQLRQAEDRKRETAEDVKKAKKALEECEERYQIKQK